MFEVGDRVRVVKLAVEEEPLYYRVGMEGHIIAVNASDVAVQFENEWWYVLPEELEKINA